MATVKELRNENEKLSCCTERQLYDKLMHITKSSNQRSELPQEKEMLQDKMKRLKYADEKENITTFSAYHSDKECVLSGTTFDIKSRLFRNEYLKLLFSAFAHIIKSKSVKEKSVKSVIETSKDTKS